MKNYILTPEELADFSNEDKRREIRLAVAELHTTDDTVIIQDEDGNIFDSVKGIQPGSEPEEVVSVKDEVSPEEVEFQKLVEAVDPEVLAALRIRAKSEVRDAIDETAAENARLKSENETISRVLAKLRSKLQGIGIETVIPDEEEITGSDLKWPGIGPEPEMGENGRIIGAPPFEGEPIPKSELELEEEERDDQ